MLVKMNESNANPKHFLQLEEFELILTELLKKKSDEIEGDIFKSYSDDQPFIFLTKPSKDLRISKVLSNLQTLIYKYGGELNLNLSAEKEYGIKLVMCNEHILNDTREDIFHCQYIIDCIKEKQILNLRNYRVNKTKYVEDFDVTKVLLKEATWSDVPLNEDLSNSSEVSDFSDDDDDTIERNYLKRKRIKKCSSKFYSMEEDIEIVNFIIKKKFYHRVTSREMWQQMDAKKILPNRTWQSLKERFLKHIYPKLNTMKLDAKTMKRFIEGHDNKKICYGSPKSCHTTKSTNDEETENVKLNEKPQRKKRNIKETNLVQEESKISHSEDSIDTIIFDEHTSHNNSQLNQSSDEVIESSIIEEDIHTPCILSFLSTPMTENPTEDLKAPQEVQNTPSAIIPNSHESPSTSRSTRPQSESPPILRSKSSVKSPSKNESSLSDTSFKSIDLPLDSTRSMSPYIALNLPTISALKPLSSPFKSTSPLKSTSESTNSPLELSSNSPRKSFSTPTTLESPLVAANISLKSPTESNTLESPLEPASSPLKSHTESNTHESPLEHVSLPIKSHTKPTSLPLTSSSNSARSSVKSPLKPINLPLKSPSKYTNSSPSRSNKLLTSSSPQKTTKSLNSPRKFVEPINEDFAVPGPSGIRRTTTANEEPSDRIQSPNEDGRLKVGKVVLNPFTQTPKKQEAEENKNYYYSFRKNKPPLRKQFNSRREEKQYSIAEDIYIINCIIKYNQYDQTKGISVWKELSERMNINSTKRTFYSLKERFLERILPNIGIYEKHGFLPAIIQRFKQSISDENIEDDTPKKTRKRGNDYHRCEKRRILNYIIEKRKFNKIKGVALWRSMSTKLEGTGNEENRTWQSLKNVFLKNILPNIRLYTKNEEILERFRAARNRKAKLKEESDEEESFALSEIKLDQLSSSEDEDFLILDKAGKNAAPKQKRRPLHSVSSEIFEMTPFVKRKSQNIDPESDSEMKKENKSPAMIEEEEEESPPKRRKVVVEEEQNNIVSPNGLKRPQIMLSRLDDEKLQSLDTKRKSQVAKSSKGSEGDSETNLSRKCNARKVNCKK